MSSIVLGLATSHSPLLTLPADAWQQRANDDRDNLRLELTDGRTLSYDQLSVEVADRYASLATLENFVVQQAGAQRALDYLAAQLAAADPDVVIIVGDDQEELFGPGATPAISIYCGDEMIMHPRTKVTPNMPEWRVTASKAYLLDDSHRFPAEPAYARGLVEQMIEQEFDVCVCTDVLEPEKAGFGHAYGFVVGRLFGGRRIPVIPILLNTYYPPNVPRASRCHDMGRALCRAIGRMPDDRRIAIIGSGGLSHFTTDESLDRRVLQAITGGDPAPLRNIPAHALRSGTSEILNWVLTAGALERLHVRWSEYVPVYRTPAGTGIGLAFAHWAPATDVTEVASAGPQ